MIRPLRPGRGAAALHLAFYNGRDFGTWLDRLVARHDRGAFAGPFSHVELVFEHRPHGASLCFSSSWRDGGARFKHIDLATCQETRKWRLVPVFTTPTQTATIRGWCVGHLGGRYDLPGVLAFKFPLIRQRLNWWFCSEICCAALQQAGLLRDVIPHRQSPNALARLARRRLGQEVGRA